MLVSELLGAEVLNESGESLGRLHDVRVEHLQRRRPEGHELKLVGIVIGGRGIRERLGLDAKKTGREVVGRELIGWERVRSIDLEHARLIVAN